MTTRDVRFEALSAAHQEIAKNGADFLRLAEIVESGGGSDAADITVDATPVEYTAASGNVEAHFEGIDTALGGLSGFNGARVTRDGGLGNLDLSDSGATVAVDWDTIAYDTGGFIDLDTDDTRIYIPANVNFVNFVCNVEVSNAGAGPEYYDGHVRYHNTVSSAAITNDSNPVEHTLNPVKSVLCFAVYNYPVVENGYLWVNISASPAHTNDMFVTPTVRTHLSIQAVG